MDLGHAVGTAGSIDGQVSHADTPAADQGHFAVSRLLLQQPLVDPPDHGVQVRHGLHEQPGLPLFKCFGHHGVVGVGEGALGDMERLFKAEAFFLKQPDQFRNRHGRMRVVELDGGQLG
ncbi:hypothetical protein SDC9_124851 [bioreactor metagenome]|uniref:Uncharacterized protein n=1 Tax=bioreactor metagenome TaxID=1076179 RepID=A0A645CLM4_9ZZZZ